MGMDLKPIRPSSDAPCNSDDGHPIWGRYNWSGWMYLIDFLKSHDIDTEEFDSANDGRKISQATSIDVAMCIECHLDELPTKYQVWLKPHIKLWRTCGGYEQW